MNIRKYQIRDGHLHQILLKLNPQLVILDLEQLLLLVQ